MISDKITDLLYVEPANTSELPVIDDLTRKMAAAWRVAKEVDSWRGWHECTGSNCGVKSTNKDYEVGGLKINSLCVHYLAFHRSEIPEAEFAKVRSLSFGEVEPTPDELKAPGATPTQSERVTRG